MDLCVWWFIDDVNILYQISVKSIWSGILIRLSCQQNHVPLPFRIHFFHRMPWGRSCNGNGWESDAPVPWYNPDGCNGMRDLPVNVPTDWGLSDGEPRNRKKSRLLPWSRWSTPVLQEGYSGYDDRWRDPVDVQTSADADPVSYTHLTLPTKRIV